MYYPILVGIVFLSMSVRVDAMEKNMSSSDSSSSKSSDFIQLSPRGVKKKSSFESLAKAPLSKKEEEALHKKGCGVSPRAILLKKERTIRINEKRLGGS